MLVVKYGVDTAENVPSKVGTQRNELLLHFHCFLCALGLRAQRALGLELRGNAQELLLHRGRRLLLGDQVRLNTFYMLFQNS